MDSQVDTEEKFVIDVMSNAQKGLAQQLSRDQLKVPNQTWTRIHALHRAVLYAILDQVDFERVVKDDALDTLDLLCTAKMALVMDIIAK